MAMVERMEKLSLSPLNETEFDKHTFDSYLPSLVFFGTRQCSVCKEQMPIIENIAFEYRNRFHIYWVDVEKYPGLFQRFRLQGIPNMLIFDQGEVKERIRGLNSEETLEQIMDQILMIHSDILR